MSLVVVQEAASMPINGSPKDVLMELRARVLRLLAKLEPYAERYNGYTLELTWVKNKVGKRYYYWYLKSKTQHPRSIYVGKSPDIDVLHKFRNKEINYVVTKLRKILALLNEALTLSDTINAAEQLVQWIEEQERSEKEARRKLQELRRLQEREPEPQIYGAR